MDETRRTYHERICGVKKNHEMCISPKCVWIEGLTHVVTPSGDSNLACRLDCSMRPGDAGLPHDLAPALDLGADEGRKLFGRLADDGQHADIAELLRDLRHRHDGFELGMELVHDVLG